MNKKTLLAGAALSGLLLSTGCSTRKAMDNNSDTKPSMTTGECHGINSCKGKGDCGGKGYSCAGKNSCKAKGWLKMTKADCEKKGGTFK